MTQTTRSPSSSRPRAAISPTTSVSSSCTERRLADAKHRWRPPSSTFAFAKRAVWALVALTIVIGAASVLVARNRWRAALWLGLGGVVGMVITRMAVRRVVDEAPNVADKAGDAPPSRRSWAKPRPVYSD